MLTVTPKLEMAGAVAMERVSRVCTEPYDVAAGIDPVGKRAERTGEIDRHEHVAAQQKRMALRRGKARTRRATAVATHDVSARVEPTERDERKGRGRGGAGNVDRREYAVVQLENMESTTRISIVAHDRAGGVDLPCVRRTGAGEIDLSPDSTSNSAVRGPLERARHNCGIGCLEGRRSMQFLGWWRDSGQR